MIRGVPEKSGRGGEQLMMVTVPVTVSVLVALETIKVTVNVPVTLYVTVGFCTPTTEEGVALGNNQIQLVGLPELWSKK